jgi:hypothetical protein
VYLSGKTGQTWDDQPGLTGEGKLDQKLYALGADYEVKYNVEPDHHQVTSQGIAAGGGWWTHTEGVTTRRCCDIWFVDMADNAYGYLEGANISPATNKVLHLHLIGGVTDPALGGLVWNVHVNTNKDSPQWGSVQIVRVNPNL